MSAAAEYDVRKVIVEAGSGAGAAAAAAGAAGDGHGDAAYSLARSGAAALLDELQERAAWGRYGL